MIKNHITKRELIDNGYVVTEYGAIWSHKRSEPKPLKTTISDGRYKAVVLTLRDREKRKSVSKKFMVHRLVCTWFHGDAPTPFHVVNHKDHNGLNNHKDNVEWMTQSENMKYCVDNGRHRWHTTTNREGHGG